MNAAPVASFAFEAKSLRVQLDGVEILHGIDAGIASGKWTAIVGPNGAGKTTLMKALARLLPAQGELRIAGRAAGEWPRADLARELAWLGQGEGFGAEDLLVEDVVMLGRLPHLPWLGAASGADEAAVQRAMQETQCVQWRRRTLGSLSGGERQRVLLARALAVRARLLLMDEPLTALDPPHQSDWLRIVRAHVAAGGTALSVLHDLTMALHADDMVVLDAGRVLHHGACADPATHRALEAVFGQRIEVHPLAGQWVVLPGA